MAISTAAEFLDLLARSKLLSESELGQARQAADSSTDATQLARSLAKTELLTRWQAGQLLAGRTTFYLGKYKLVDFLGRGASGSVFLARHTALNRAVVLKLIARHLVRDEASCDRFLTEARAAASVDHPNVVHALCVDKEGDRYYLVLEYVEGRDLHGLVETDGPLDFTRAADYIRQAAEGLAHAHSRGLVHGGIRPGKLLVNGQGVVKILDLGTAVLSPAAATAAEDDSAETSVRVAEYLAPEQMLPQPVCDPRTDLYALGATFYYLLTGNSPAAGTEAPAIETVRPHCPAELASVCRTLMARDPAERWQSADQAAEALADWLTTQSSVRTDPAGAIVSAASEDPPAINIEIDPAPRIAGKRNGIRGRTARGKTASRTAQRADADTDAAGAPAGQSFLDRHRKPILIGGGLVAAAALLVIGVLLGQMFSRVPPSNQPPAVAPGGMPPAADPSLSPPADNPPAEPPDDAESPEGAWKNVPAPDAEFDPLAVPNVPANKSGRKQPGKGKANPPTPAQPAEMTAQFAGSARTSASTPNATGPAGDSPDAAAAPPAGNPQQPAAAKPAAPPDQPPPESKPASPEPKSEPSPGPKPEEKPAAPDDPFRYLPVVFELPPAGDSPAEPVVIGTVHTPAEASWQLLLLGGDTALRSAPRATRQFELVDRAGASGQEGWLVHSVEQPRDGEKTVADVARFWRDGESLKFQWVEGAKADTANFFRNCVLDIRVPGGRRSIALTKPLTAEPLVIDLVRGAPQANIASKSLPDEERLRIEITRIEGWDGAYVVEPPAPALPKSLKLKRKDRNNNDQDALLFQVAFDVRPTGLTARLQLRKPEPEEFRSFQNQPLNVLRNPIDATLKKIDDKLNPRDKDKAPKAAEKVQLLEQQRIGDASLWYIDFFEKAHRKARVHFRVSTEVKGYDKPLVLVETVSPPAAAADAPEEAGATEKPTQPRPR